MATERVLIRLQLAGQAQYVGGMQAATDVTVEFERTTEAANTATKRFSGALTSIKTLVAAWGVDKAVNAAANFQAQMERLNTQAGVSQSKIKGLTSSVLGMATGLAQGPQSLAAALYHIESARIPDALGALTVAAKGADIGGADLTDTVNSLDAALISGLKGVGNYQNAMAVLNSTVGTGDMTMSDLTDALGNSGLLSAAGEFGLSIKDVGAALAVFGDNNQRGSAAATHLRMALVQMAGPTAQAQKFLGSVGISAAELHDKLQQPDGLLKALEDLRGHLEELPGGPQADKILNSGLTGPKLEDALKDAALHGSAAAQVLVRSFGGGRQAAGILLLLSQIDRLKSKYDILGAGVKNFNKDWDHTKATLQFLINQMKTFGEVLLIKVGGAIGQVAEWINNKFIPALKQGKFWAQLLAAVLGAAGLGLTIDYLIGKFGALVAAMMATDAFAVLSLIPTIGSVADALALLGLAIDAIPIVGWIALAITLLIMLALNWRKVKDAAVDMFNKVKGAAVDVFNWLVSHWKLVLAVLTGPIGIAAYFIITHWKLVKAAFMDAFNWLQRHWELVVSIIIGPIGAAILYVVTHFGKIKMVISNVWTAIKDEAKSVWHDIVGAIVTAINWVIKALDKIHVKVPSWVPLAGGKTFGFNVAPIGTPPSMATGGSSAGASGYRALGGDVEYPGFYNVGENGPERVFLPGGAFVSNATDAGTLEATIPVYIDGRVVALAMQKVGLQEAARS